MSPRTRRRPGRTPIWPRITIVGLIGLLAAGVYQIWDKERRAPGEGTPALEFTVEGLDCPVWCAVRVTDAVDDLDGASIESWDRAAGTIVIRHDPRRQSDETLRRLIEAAGFPVLEMRPVGR